MDAEAALGYQGGLAGRSAVARLFAYRSCLSLLAARAVKVRYRRSILGFGWSLAYPLIAMLVLSMVFSRVFPEIPDYPVYVIVGLFAWGFFSLGCVQAMDGLIGGAALMRKVYVPAAVFPLSQIAANLVNFVLSLAVLPFVVWALGVDVDIAWGWAALSVLLMLGFTTGFGLLLSALNLFFRDVRYFFDALSLVWFYATPIVYPAEVLPEAYRALLWFNPLYWLILALREPLYAGRAPEFETLAAAAAAALITLAAGWAAFARLERRFHLYL